MKDKITIHGARTHNLKNVNLEIPRDKITVIVGISGSGKSSLAFDTLFAESQRRYVENLSSFARQFLGEVKKPDVDYIEGLSPSISIDQRNLNRSPRSTVGTMSEIYDYLRLLFVNASQVNCPVCKKPIQKQFVKMPAEKMAVLKSRTIKQNKAIEKELYRCDQCDFTFGEINLSSFSFNSPTGACNKCQGLGIRYEIDPKLIVPNPRLTLAEGAIRPWSRLASHSNKYQQELLSLAKRNHFRLDVEYQKLSVRIQKIIMYGDDEFEGIVNNLERRYGETDSDYIRNEIEKYMVQRKCQYCGGARLKEEFLAIKFFDKNIAELSQMSLKELGSFFDKIYLSHAKTEIVETLLKEIKTRLVILKNLGLSYLTLDRSSETLAGGELQRIRLATQLSSGLTGLIYVLDEPSIGLHQRDHEQLIKNLQHLRDLGNTIVVVEHDRLTMEKADWLVDVGPGAGESGGQIIAKGTPAQIKENRESLTGLYLSNKKKIYVPSKRRKPSEKVIMIRGASEHNLKNIDVKIPLNTFVCMSGVSGSGKSSLVLDILANALARKFYGAKAEAGKHRAIVGIQNIDKVVTINQAPIGRTPRSNAATYSGVFTEIRDLFAATSEAVRDNILAAKFSFNLKGGRCEACRGDGMIKIEMHFLPDIFSVCEKCHGTRYREEILAIKYKDKNIAGVLEMTVEEAEKFFVDNPQITEKLKVLRKVGLGYLKLGQPATTLSGGEAQRVKLATELARKETGSALYILDEPTSGLHFEDISRLLKVLHQLVDRGNTVLVVEHNLDVIKSADWVIDLGPEGGDEGGEIVAEGSPEKIAKVEKSYTGQYLKKELGK